MEVSAAKAGCSGMSSLTQLVLGWITYTLSSVSAVLDSFHIGGELCSVGVQDCRTVF